MADYVVWENDTGPNDCSLTDFKGFEKTFPLMSGQSLEATYPDDTSFSMDPEDPNNTLLTDSLSNTNLVIVASERLCDFFRNAKVPAVEYLPVTILDHKGKPIEESYSILHPIDPIDCLDLDNIDAEYSPVLPDQIDEVDELLILEDKIPDDRVFFRCLNFNDAILVKRSFADSLLENGFTGFEWCELEDFEA